MIGQAIDNRIMKILQKFFSFNTSETILQFVKSLFAGGFATLVDFGVLTLLNKVFNVHYLVAAALSFICGLIVNYIITSVWVFNRRTLEDRRMEFIVFTIIALIGLGMNLLIMWICTGLADFDVLISKAIATVVVYGFNFAARKIILYR